MYMHANQTTHTKKEHSNCNSLGRIKVEEFNLSLLINLINTPVVAYPPIVALEDDEEKRLLQTQIERKKKNYFFSSSFQTDISEIHKPDTKVIMQTFQTLDAICTSYSSSTKTSLNKV